MKKQIKNIEDTIKEWLFTLIDKQEMPKHIISSDFNIEDGMTLEEYWLYEKNSFDSFSKIFDLNNKFDIKIIHKERIREDAQLVWFYVLNYKNKITFKMSMTINNKKEVSSNNFNTQFVTKYKIKKNKIESLGLAIRSSKKINNIVSPGLELLNFSEGSNFKVDGFYSATFASEDLLFNKTNTFFIKFSDNIEKEKRVVFFDELRLEDCPYEIKQGNVFIRNEKYPVNLAIFYKNGDYKNYEYPRNINIDLTGVLKIVVTDVLDNDWEEII